MLYYDEIAQNNESADIDCLVFFKHIVKMEKIWQKYKSVVRFFFTDFD